MKTFESDSFQNLIFFQHILSHTTPPPPKAYATCFITRCIYYFFYMQKNFYKKITVESSKGALKKKHSRPRSINLTTLSDCRSASEWHLFIENNRYYQVTRQILRREAEKQNALYTRNGPGGGRVRIIKPNYA